MQMLSGCKYFVLTFNKHAFGDGKMLYCLSCSILSSEIWNLNESHTSMRLVKEKFVHTFSI